MLKQLSITLDKRILQIQLNNAKMSKKKSKVTKDNVEATTEVLYM